MEYGWSVCSPFKASFANGIFFVLFPLFLSAAFQNGIFSFFLGVDFLLVIGHIAFLSSVSVSYYLFLNSLNSAPILLS